MRAKLRRADDHLRWLRGQYKNPYNGNGKHLPQLGVLTGIDHKALEAIDRAWDLFAYGRSLRVLRAIAYLAAEMQPQSRPLARELAARAMDWGDRARYWPTVESYIADVTSNRQETCSYCDASGYHKDDCTRPEAHR